jgi:FkbM family methyltransferase
MDSNKIIQFMNPVAQFIRKAVINAGAEEFFVRLRRKSNVIRNAIPVGLRNKFPSVGRFIPNASDYPATDSYRLTRDHTHFQINRSDYVQWRLFYGVRDNALLEAKKHLRDGGIVLDIGANIGAFSLRLASHIFQQSITSVQIHAFEPNPVVAKHYVDNLSLNPAIQNIVRLHPIGLGNKKGERSIAYENSNTGAGRITEQQASHRANIQIERLDDWVEVLKPAKIAFIKLIVEGFEPEVFNGGWKTISKYKPPIFFEVTECWWEENNSTIEEVLVKLRALGYRFMIEHHNEMLPYEPSRYASRTQFNLLATI